MTDQARIHELLVGAHNHITRYGWTRTWGRVQKPVCLMGGIGVAAGYGLGPHYLYYSPEGAECARVLGFASVKDAIRWNDGRRTTKAKVLARLEQAIKATAPALELPARLPSSHEFDL